MAGTRLPQDYPKYAAIQDAIASGQSAREICRNLRVDPRTLKKYFPNSGGQKGGGNGKLPESNPEKLKRIGLLVADGASLNEIMRSEGVDHRTVKRYFPNAGWGSPGGEGASLMKKSREII